MQQTDKRQADHITGSDLPSGDGGVGDEQVNAISDDGLGQRTGQDHSTEGHERTEPTDGVGAVQDANEIGSDVADISE